MAQAEAQAVLPPSGVVQTSAPAQALPQLPQFFGSLARSTQAPPQVVVNGQKQAPA